MKPQLTAKGIQIAALKWAVLTMSTDNRASYDRYLQGLSDESSMLLSTFSEGEQAGILKEKCVIAKAMTADGMGLEPIARVTGLLLSPHYHLVAFALRRPIFQCHRSCLALLSWGKEGECLVQPRTHRRLRHHPSQV